MRAFAPGSRPARPRPGISSMRLAESLDSTEVVIAASEARDGLWSVSLHFRQPPNQAAVRALVALAAGAQIANALVFESIAATDWVQASLAGLTPVAAGRFLVHGAHDRARVPRQPHRHRDRGGAGVRDRPSRHHPRLPPRARPVRAGPARSPGPTPEGSRSRHRQRRARHRGRARLAASRAGERQRPARGQCRASECAAQPRRCGGRGHPGRWLQCERVSARAGRSISIFANILLEPLKRMATPMARLLAANGHVILSGLLAGQARTALAAYRARGLVLEHRIPLDGWVTLVLRGGPQVPGSRRAVAACRHGQ